MYILQNVNFTTDKGRTTKNKGQNKKEKRRNEIASSQLVHFSLFSYCGTGGCAPGGIIQTSTVVFGRFPHLVITIRLGSTPRVLTR